MRGTTKVLTVFGTRPEVIKMAPVVRQLQLRPTTFTPVVCVTGQHREMLDQALDIFGIKPDFDLQLMTENQSLCGLSARALLSLDGVMREVRPKLVVVQGDTSTAMVAALAAFYRKIPVAHVEAGLRTGLRYSPFPEEMNRKLISALATYHFAPTELACQALLGEGIPEESIFVTGNTVIDAITYIAAYYDAKSDLRGAPCDHGEQTILVTAHRREHFGKAFEEICLALRDIADTCQGVKIIYPVHLNPNVRKPVSRILGNHDRIQLLGPVPYQDFVRLMVKAYLILTDSGGIQEEAAALHKPVLVMRRSTEREEGVRAGVARLVGVNRADIVRWTKTLLENTDEYRRMANAPNPYGDGHAAERIVNILAAQCATQKWK